MSKKRTFNESFGGIGSGTDEMSSAKRRKHDEIVNDRIPTSLSESLEEKQSNCDKIINLQVGERKYVTRISTLTQHGSDGTSYFASLFSGRFTSTETYNGSYFIDRDGDMFAYILSYLRSGTLTFDDSKVLPKLLIEAKYYMMESLVRKITKLMSKGENSDDDSVDNSILPKSQILTESELVSLENLFDGDDMKRVWELKLSETMSISDGAGAKVIYDPSKRQWPSPSIVVVEDICGNVFGVKSRFGICRFSALFPNGDSDEYSELMDEQESIYFNIRDADNKIAPLAVFGECNEVMTAFQSHFMSNTQRSYFLGCYMTTNKKSGNCHDRVRYLLIPSDLKSAGVRVTSLPKGSDDIVHSKFITARIEVFVKTKRNR